MVSDEENGDDQKVSLFFSSSFSFFVILISSFDFVLRVFGYSNSGPVSFDGSQGTFFFFGSWVYANL